MYSIITIGLFGLLGLPSTQRHDRSTYQKRDINQKRNNITQDKAMKTKTNLLKFRASLECSFHGWNPVEGR